MSTAPHYTGFPLKIRVVPFLFLKHSSSIAWVRLSAGVSHFYVWIIVPYTWHQTLGCLVTRPACSSGHCHCSGMHSLSTQSRNMSVTQHSRLSQIPLLKTLLFFTSLCLSAVFVYISIYSKTTAVFSPTPHKLESTQKHLHTALYLIMLMQTVKTAWSSEIYIHLFWD